MRYSIPLQSVKVFVTTLSADLVDTNPFYPPKRLHVDYEHMRIDI